MVMQSTHRMPAISSSTKNTLYQLASAESAMQHHSIPVEASVRQQGLRDD